MKVLFLFPHFLTPGGAATVVLQFANALQSRGHQVQIICAKVSEEFRKQNPDLSFKELKIPTSNSFFYWLFFPYWQLKINKHLNFYKDHILFPHVLPSNWWSWMFKQTHANTKVVWYCHEPSAFIHSPIWINALSNKFMKQGAKVLNPFLKRKDIELEKQNNTVICNSYFTKEQYERTYKKKACTVIYPPCPIKNVHIEKNKENYVLTVCRLSKFKNVDLLIRTIKTLSNDLPDCKLMIVGDGEEKEQLMKITNDLNLEKQILFLGSKSHEQLIKLYQKAKVTIICSHEETFGLVPVESMICGTPVIAHCSGGPRETIRHGNTGYLYNDTTELAAFIKEIFKMEESRYFEMQQQCQQNAAQYDVAHSIIQLEAVLNSIV